MNLTLSDLLSGGTPQGSGAGVSAGAAPDGADAPSFSLARAMHALQPKGDENIAIPQSLTAITPGTPRSGPAAGSAMAPLRELAPEPPHRLDMAAMLTEQPAAPDSMPSGAVLTRQQILDEYRGVEPEIAGRSAAADGKELPLTDAESIDLVAIPATVLPDQRPVAARPANRPGTGVATPPILSDPGTGALGESETASSLGRPQPSDLVAAQSTKSVAPAQVGAPPVEGTAESGLARFDTEAGSVTPRTAALADTPVLTLERPLQNPGWNQAVGQRILWMADNKIQSAELRLDPPELGSIDVEISIADDEAHVRFLAQNTQTREALESALPRLREMFAEQGLTLSHADVSDQRQTAERHANGNSSSGDNGMSDTEVSDAARPRGQTHDGIVDEYA